MGASCRRHTWSGKRPRSLGVETMVKRHHKFRLLLLSCVQGSKTVLSDGKNDATHAQGRGGELDSMRVEYSEPLAAWVFPKQVTHRVYAAHKVDGCALARFVCTSKTNRGRSKKQSQGKKGTTNTTRELRNDQHRAACTPHSTLYSSQESNSLHILRRLPSDVVYSLRWG